MKCLDKQDIFVFKRLKKENLNKDHIVFMIPITEKDYKEAKISLDLEEPVVLQCGMTIKYNAVQLIGDTFNLDEDIINKNFKIEHMWFTSMKNYKTREYKTNHLGYPSLTEFNSKLQIIELAIGMLGNPELVIVAEMSFDNYTNSDFYKNVIQPKSCNDEYISKCKR